MLVEKNFKSAFHVTSGDCPYIESYHTVHENYLRCYDSYTQTKHKSLVVCRVQGLGVQGLGVQGLGVQGLGVQGLGVQGLGYRA